VPSRSSAPDDPFAAAHAVAVDTVRRSVAALPTPHAVVLIDGRSGGGKTTLADRLQRSWPRPGERPQLVALDSLYPGWDGLAEGSRLARSWLLEPHAAGRDGRWRRYDWVEGRFAEEHVVSPERPLIVEGAGAVTPGTAALADLVVWVQAPSASRRRRALARDGDGYAPHWDRWAAQEERHIADHDPARLAHLVVDLP